MQEIKDKIAIILHLLYHDESISLLCIKQLNIVSHSIPHFYE